MNKDRLKYKESPWFAKTEFPPGKTIYPPRAEPHVGTFECTTCGIPHTYTLYGTYYKHELFCSAQCMLDWHEQQRHNESNLGDRNERCHPDKSKVSRR